MPGGKLVAVDVVRDVNGQVTSCRIDGDFFIEGDADALLRDLERGLIEGCDISAIIAHHQDAQLVGVTANAIETAYRRALGEQVDTNIAARHTPSNQTDDWSARWQRLAEQLEVVLDTPRSPSEQMQIDEQWAREVAQGSRPATLRIWDWASPAVVVGRFQSIDDEVNQNIAQAEGFEVVRRCTGGGAMFVKPSDTITYSLISPLWFTRGIPIEQSYQLCDQWLLDTLRDLHLNASFGGLNDIVSSQGKIGGAAQRRFPGNPGALLHHVTLAYDFDTETMGRILNTSREKLSDKAVKSAVRRVAPLVQQTSLSRQDVVRAMVNHVGTMVEAAHRESTQ